MSTLETLSITYLSDIRKQRAQSNPTKELSYRDFLGVFLRGAKDLLGKTAEFTGEAKKNTFGRPDYEVTNGAKVIGYVEAEALNAPLAELTGHAKEQNERFRLNLHNFLLTNHYEFRLFLDGQLVKTARLPEPPEHGPITVSAAALDELRDLLEQFLDASTPAANTPEEIARALARRARFLRVAADAMLSQDESPLHVYWELYRQTLFDGMDKEKFADVYAQTFTYGLFLAWLNTTGLIFDRETALRAIPKAVPPIRTLMQFSAFGSLPEAFHWIVDGICSDLESASRETATKHKSAFDDPLVHFYEPFLAAYDPGLRERAGVYYTPDPVVDFIVRAVDDVLKRDFGKAEGLADSSVHLLDPATGTATFLARAYRQAYQTMQAGEDAKYWPDRAKDHLAKHFYGFERLPAAYTLAHVKLRQLLSELKADLPDTVRLPVYLADTMMNKIPEQINLPGADVLSKEIREAANVRDQHEILVVIGNPPYNGKSDNPSRDTKNQLTFIGRLIEDYKKVDGNKIKDRGGLKWLQNDYVKFIRFAQWRIERSKVGIVAFITANSYLDGSIHRGMRQQLMQTFDEIYIYNLHGNSERQERSPDGSKDENVFDIEEGVAIALCIRRKAATRSEAKVHYIDVYGTRQAKYDKLRAIDYLSISGDTFIPQSPSYFFTPQHPQHASEAEHPEHDLVDEYEQGWSLAKIFDQNGGPGPGIVTTQDEFAIAWTEAEAIRKVEKLLATTTEEEARKLFQLCEQDQWNYTTAKRELQDNKWRHKLIQLACKPLDIRWTVFDSNVAVHLRERVMRHMLDGQNIGFITTKATKNEWVCWVSNIAIRHKALATYDINYLFPLYLNAETEGLIQSERRANLNPAFVAALAERVGTAPTPKDVFHYAYAVFHAPTYRTRYAPFLKIDFPRLPLPPDADTFHALAALGAKLVSLHLLESPALTPTGIAYPVSGTHLVEKRSAARRYAPPTTDGAPGRVFLNETEVFDNVPPEAWEFRVGGYQPAFKWLDDRAGRVLTEADLTHYRKMLAALRETSALLPLLDGTFARMLPVVGLEVLGS